MTATTATDAPPSWFTAALASEPTAGSLRGRDVTVATRTWGRGPQPEVVLVHGGGAHSRWWDHVAPLLADDRRITALDLAGHGDSGRRPTYSIDSWAEDLRTVVESAGPRPIVIGHSLGGMVTLRLAQSAGPTLGGVVLIDSIIGAATSDPADPASNISSAPLRVYDSAASAIARFRPVPFQPGDPWTMQHVAETSVQQVSGGWSWKFDPRAFEADIFQPMPTRALACRSAYLRAEHGLVDAPAAARIGRALGRAIVVDVPAAGHHVMLDQPLALVAAIRVLLAAWDA